MLIPQRSPSPVFSVLHDVDGLGNYGLVLDAVQRNLTSYGHITLPVGALNQWI